MSVLSFIVMIMTIAGATMVLIAELATDYRNERYPVYAFAVLFTGFGAAWLLK